MASVLAFGPHYVNIRVKVAKNIKIMVFGAWPLGIVIVVTNTIITKNKGFQSDPWTLNPKPGVTLDLGCAGGYPCFQDFSAACC